MAGHQSAQYRMLLRFLHQHSEDSFTIEEIAARMPGELSRRDAPGKSTIYRLMKRLVESGTVKRFVRGSSRQFVYQIAGREDCGCHLHLKCIKCGCLIHLDNDGTDMVVRQAMERAHFTVDREATVLFGLCQTCANR